MKQLCRAIAAACGRAGRRSSLGVRAAAACLVAAGLGGHLDRADARLVRLSVEERLPFIGGVDWGATGPYERLKGTAYMEVDPRDPLNALIVDLDKAPRNARGMVEFSTPFFIIKPVDMARGNQKIYYSVNNRGNNALLNAQTVAQVGNDDVYLRMGYTIADAGWEGDLVPAPVRLAANLPTATNSDGSAIVGPMRIEYSDRNLPLAGAFTSTLKGNATYKSYEAADTNTANSTLTVRDTMNSPKVPIAADRWAFGSCPTGQASLVPSSFDICYFDGFRNDRIYELIYPAKNPIVMALGHATTRDFASFLRYAVADDIGTPNPLRPSAGQPPIRRAYATGASQTGAYLRDFMFYGFNEDEAHRRVFDGIIPTITGGIRNHLNVRFADPDVYSTRDFQHDFLQNAYPPFTYAVTADPISGITDGILKRPATDPFVFQLDTSTEFWQLQASRVVVDGLGNPLPVPANVRLYFNSSMGHGSTTGGLRVNPPTTSALCANPVPGGGIADTHRALLVAMDLWVEQGIPPPPSTYPRVEDGTLVSVADYQAAFPTIPGIGKPAGQNTYELLDFGPTFTSIGGVRSKEPPTLGPTYQSFVPKPDADGLDLAGVRPMQIRVPLGTTTGWNLRNAAHRPADSLCGITGMYVAFADTPAQRQAAGDPRLSVQERYGSHAGFVSAVVRAAKDLVRARFLLKEDADRYIDAAAQSNVLE